MDRALTTEGNLEPSLSTPFLTQEHIVCTPETCGGKPRINGTRIRVKDIVLWHARMGMSPEEIVSEWSHSALGDVYAALSYYYDNREGIDAELTAEAAFAAELEAKTSLTARRPAKLDAAGDPVPT